MTLKRQESTPPLFRGRTLLRYEVFEEKKGLAVGHPSGSTRVIGPIVMAKLA